MAKKVFEHQFTGAEELSDIFKELPARYGKKPVITTFRKAARPFIKTLRSLTPRRSGETRKGIGVTAGRSAEYPSIMAGFKKPGRSFSWFKAYWHNYGTLSNRDPRHTFKNSRKSKSAGWQGGVRPKGFIEQAWEATSEQAQRVIETEMKAETIKFLKKNAVR
ncbi:MAG: hypothetical protein ACLFQA_00390 [Bacteroidales bacterium]